jgi:Glycosyl hydrolase family 26
MKRTLFRAGRHGAPPVPSVGPAAPSTARASVNRRKRRLTAVFASVVAVGVAAQLHVLAPGGDTASAATVAIQPLQSGKTLSGVTGHGGLAALNAFGAWRGKAVDVSVGYISAGTWSSMTGVTQQGLTKILAGSSAHRVWSVGLLPIDGGADLNSAAAGAYNSKYAAIAQGLVAGGDGSSTIRLGWEGNGNWYPWYGGNNPSAFVGAWRQAVNSMRSVAGAHFTFDFNISLGAANPAPMYPGDSYVDIIGADLYDYSWASNFPATDHTAVWNQLLTMQYGLNWLTSFAGSHGKRMSLPEWGLSYRCDDNHAGGDDPYFIQQVHNWVSSHNVAYESYFNADDSSCHRFSMTEGNFPNAAALYRTLFKGTGSSPGGTVTPTTNPPTTSPVTTTKPPTSTTTPPAATGSLALSSVRVSNNPNRTGSVTADGSTISGAQYIFVNPPSGTVKVRFYLDRPTSSTPNNTEAWAPWDFAGSNGAQAKSWNASSVAKGWHELIVLATLSNGSTQSATSWIKTQ